MSDFNLNDRLLAGKILRLVLTGRLCVREALLEYPKDPEDESLIAGYFALIHYEADEDLRRRDELYKQEQDDYLEFLSYTLEKGEDVPDNIVDNYKQLYDFVPVLHKKGLKGFLKSYWKNLNIKD